MFSKFFIILVVTVFASINMNASKIVKVIKGNIVSLDPNISANEISAPPIIDMFEGFYLLDRNGKVIPALAKSYRTSKDGKTVTVTIKKAYWSDGKQITASDFVYGLNRLANPKTASDFSWYLSTMHIKNANRVVTGKSSKLGIKALSKTKIEFKLNKPTPYFKAMLANYMIVPLRKDIIEKYGKDWTKPSHIVVNGAYKLKNWRVNERVVLVKNSKYRNSKNVGIDKVIYLPIADESVALKRFIAGEVDFTDSIPPSNYNQVKKDYAKDFKNSPQLRTMFYTFNTNYKPFKDVRVRKALSLAINRDILIKHVIKIGYKPLYNIVPNGLNGYKSYRSKESLMSQKDRNMIAKKLLSEAGYNKNNPLKFRLLYNTSGLQKSVVVAIYSMWRQVFGRDTVKVTLENQEYKTFLSTRKIKANFEMARGGWGADYADPNTFLSVFSKVYDVPDFTVNDKKFELYMRKSETTMNKKKREALYRKSEKRLVEGYYTIPLYLKSISRLVNRKIKGYPKLSPFDKSPTKYLYY